MVWPPMRMVLSVTDDSSFVVAGSHFSGALASGARASLSGAGACAATRGAWTNRKISANAHRLRNFLIGLLSLAEFDCDAAGERAGLYVEGEVESKEAGHDSCSVTGDR